MLLGVHHLLRGPLLAALDAMGHGDLLVVADAEFPAHRLCPAVVDLPGVDAPRALRALRTVLPVDAAEPLSFMAAPDGWLPVQQELLDAAAEPGAPVERVERRAFYDLAAGARLVVATGEHRPYGNLVLRKGVVGGPGSGAPEGA